MDLRVERTLSSIDDAIAVLLDEKDFEHITVKDICEKAKIRRVTFYCYYQDKYDLIHQLIDRWFDKVVGNRKTSENETFNQYYYSIVESSLSNLKNHNVDVFSNASNFKSFQNTLKECMISKLKEKAGNIRNLNETDIELLLLLYANCYVSILEIYIKSDTFTYDNLISSMKALLNENHNR